MARMVCRERRMRNFKVVSPPEMLGIRTVMDENELIQILGGGGGGGPREF